MTPKQRLKLAHDILSSDSAFEADCVMLDEANDRPVSEREKALAQVVHELYFLIHPLFCKADHQDWEAKNAALFAKRK